MTSVLSRQAADEEDVVDARSITRVLGRSADQPAIPEGLVTGDAAAIDRLLVDDVRRTKVWAADGTILYSERTELIGAVYPLADEEMDVIDAGGTDAEVSGLTRPDNRYEPELGGDLLEVYTRIRAREGDPLLFEAYFSADELDEVGRSLRVSMRSLRSLLVEIYPPDLHTAGLAAAVHDLPSCPPARPRCSAWSSGACSTSRSPPASASPSERSRRT